MDYMRINKILKTKPVGNKIEVKGWLKSARVSKNVSFLDVNDGSCLANLQVVADEALENYQTEVKKLSCGCAVKVVGELIDSPAKGQDVELKPESLEVIGWADEKYPLQKKRHSFEFLREIAHLRPRTNSLAAVFRVRNALSFAVHTFFQERDFVHIHTPIISTGDCEGAGETFTVSNFAFDSIPQKDGKVDWKSDFFGCQANLTVSGQLEAEAYALALGNVYTFGPTFRAENSNTSRHLAEFWMVEPEMAFCDLVGDINLAEAFLKHLVQYVLEHCQEDLDLFAKFIDNQLMDKLQGVVAEDFVRITYTEAADILTKSKHSFNYQVKWGSDLQAEHERHLTEDVFKKPVVVTDYPKTIKPFYMRVNDDGKTVAAMDVLLPGIGEIIGGSQREERYEILADRMKKMAMQIDEYSWYTDLRRYGTVPHAGFGLGFERIVQFVTGMKNIRDVIPFPRTPGAAGF